MSFNSFNFSLFIIFLFTFFIRINELLFVINFYKINNILEKFFRLSIFINIILKNKKRLQFMLNKNSIYIFFRKR